MSSALISIRLLAQSELPLAEALLIESFASHMRPYMTHSQPGIGQFLARTLWPDKSVDLVGAVDSTGQVVGYAECIEVVEHTTYHLNYICVHHSVRRAGIARRLLGFLLQRRTRLTTLDLHVFESNKPARGLYRSLGFVDIGSADWWTRPIESVPTDVGDIAFEDLEGTRRDFAHHGFAWLKLQHKGTEHKLGVTSPMAIRALSEEAYANSRLLAKVRQELPTIQFCYIIAAQGKEPQVGVLLERSLRMSVSRTTLAGRLTER